MNTITITSNGTIQAMNILRLANENTTYTSNDILIGALIGLGVVVVGSLIVWLITR